MTLARAKMACAASWMWSTSRAGEAPRRPERESKMPGTCEGGGVEPMTPQTSVGIIPAPYCAALPAGECGCTEAPRPCPGTHQPWQFHGKHLACAGSTKMHEDETESDAGRHPNQTPNTPNPHPRTNCGLLHFEGGCRSRACTEPPSTAPASSAHATAPWLACAWRQDPSRPTRATVGRHQRRTPLSGSRASSRDCRWGHLGLALLPLPPTQ